MRHDKIYVSGFTLIEVLVAISILTTVLFMPLSIITQYLVETSLTEKHVKANLLAQEVIEYVRYDRDSELFVAGEWFDKLKLHDGGRNPYSKCVTEESSLLNTPQNTTPSIRYCEVQCTDAGVAGDCGSGQGFVSGVYQTTRNPPGSRDSDSATCDGATAQDGDYTATLTIIIPAGARSLNGDVWHAVIRPCVSWKDGSGTVQKVELEEVIYRWLERK